MYHMGHVTRFLHFSQQLMRHRFEILGNTIKGTNECLYYPTFLSKKGFSNKFLCNYENLGQCKCFLMPLI